MRLRVPLDKAYRLLNHGPTVLITTAAEGHRNVMAAAWIMPLDFSPPKVALVIDKLTYSRTLLEASGELVINIPPRSMVDQTLAVGSISGRDLDKFNELGLKTMAAEKVTPPLLSNCIAWLECRLIPQPQLQQDHDLFLAEVVAASANNLVFREGRWHFGENAQRTLHHVAGGHFLQIGDEVEAKEP